MGESEPNEPVTPFPFFHHKAADAQRGELVSAGAEAVRSIHVLLIEDNRGDARLIQEYLAEVEGLSFELHTVERFGDGLDRLLQGGIDVVLLDLNLPDTRGLETFVHLHALYPTIPVVVLTGFDDELLAVKAVQEGAEDYLVKGYVNSNLLARSLRYAIERNRRRQAERSLRETEEKMHIAHTIQRRLFPEAAPRIDGYDIAGASFPAEATGGDYFDFLPMLDGSLGIVISDVTGHGFGPALLMASTRAYLRALSQAQHEVGAILTLANRVLCMDIGDDRFVTLLMGRLEPSSRRLVFGNAGHPSGYIFDAEGALKHQLASSSIPLGVFADQEFTASEPICLEPGDLVLFATDGAVEARGPDNTAFGTTRLFELIRRQRAEPARAIVEALYQAVRAFSAHAPQLDDITVVVLKVTS
jgi:sigma-B regulation protein RsbU (phosphoserine phosphatase)